MSFSSTILIPNSEIRRIPEDPAENTHVLVHGAFADSSSWEGVTRILLAQKYPVVAFANPLRSVQSDADWEGFRCPLEASCDKLLPAFYLVSYADSWIFSASLTITDSLEIVF